AEKYSLPTSVTTRFVRVTANGNTENQWASITELSVDGFSNNNLPTADNKSVNTKAGTPVTITLTATSPIPNDVNLKFSVLSMPQNGKLATGTTSNTVTYTPNPGFSGTDTFTYKATDGQGVSSNIATVTITVSAVQNNPPTADNKAVSTNAGTPVQITLTGHDPLPLPDVLKFSVVANPTHGNLSSTTSNTVTYTPNPGFSGTDTFTYKATDGQGVSSNIATVTIIVSNATLGNLDQFGVKELNPSKPGGEQWFFNGATGNPNNDPRTGTPNEGPHTTFAGKNPDGSWKVKSSEVRYGILTSTFFQENQIKTLNQQQMAAQGYMLRPNDWKNVELTAYLRVVQASSSTSNGASHIEFGAHGARNTNGG